MSRATQRFRQTDVTKAVKAAMAAGLAVARVEVSPEGSIIVIAGPTEPEQSSAFLTPLEKWRAERGQG
ncbi:hypothetical protein ABIF64_000459 [Bradyrhizobium japonicum]